ncbi:hypothetical protein ACFQ0O_17705 [Saccharopolyspora spinosporotrichia]
MFLGESGPQRLPGLFLLAPQLVEPFQRGGALLGKRALQPGDALVGRADPVQGVLAIGASGLGFLLGRPTFAERLVPVSERLLRLLRGSGLLAARCLDFGAGAFRVGHGPVPFGFGGPRGFLRLPALGVRGVAGIQSGGEFAGGVLLQGGDLRAHRIEHGQHGRHPFVQGVHVELGHGLVGTVDLDPDLAVLIQHRAGDGLGPQFP